jgi:serine/threonine protein kinase
MSLCLTSAAWTLPGIGTFALNGFIDYVYQSYGAIAGIMHVVAAPRMIQRFEVVGHLGTGGMGSVFRARDPQLDRDVAIKVLADVDVRARPGLLPTQTIDLRRDGTIGDLLREARMMAQLSHPNVLPVYEVGLVDDAVFVVMEHVDGCDLRKWLDLPRSAAEILDAFAQAGRGIAAAHARGIVHRDIKPENVLVGRDGRIRVADFGLSQLGARTAALVQIADHRGTPRYMARELWNGGAATVRSDVFAFCTALSEALEGHEVAPELRELLARGVDGAPAMRPALDEILAALGGRPSSRRRRWPLIAAASACLVLGAGVVRVASSRSHATCEPAALAGRWDDVRRVVFRAIFSGMPSARLAAAIDTLDARRVAIVDIAHTACLAEARGELTAAQAATRTWCAERRAFELGADVDHLLAKRPSPIEVLNRTRAVARAEFCTEIDAPPPIDLAASRALYPRLVTLYELMPAERALAAAAIEHDATAAGDLELAARGALERGIAQWQNDDLTGADETLSRANRLALDVHTTNYAAIAMAERSRVAGMRGDPNGERGFGQAALDLASKPTVAPNVKARIYDVLGRADRDRGDLAAAAEKLQKALDLLAQAGHPDSSSELNIRLALIKTLEETEDHVPLALKLARETVDQTRADFGTHDTGYAIALNMLADVMLASNDPVGALPYERASLVAELETMPRDHPNIYKTRLGLALDLLRCGQYDEARQQVRIVIDRAVHSDQLKADLPEAHATLGQVTFGLGQFEDGLHQLDDAIDEFGSQYGKDSPNANRYRPVAIEELLALGRVDEAAARIGALDRSYRTQPSSATRELAYLHGVDAAEVARVRHHLPEAEALARAALATLVERHDLYDEEQVEVELARVLIDEHDYDAATAALARARELALGRRARDEDLAEIDVQVARVDAATGKRDDALRLAAHARDVLAHFPADFQAIAAARAVLGH